MYYGQRRLSNESWHSVIAPRSINFRKPVLTHHKSNLIFLFLPPHSYNPCNSHKLLVFIQPYSLFAAAVFTGSSGAGNATAAESGFCVNFNWPTELQFLTTSRYNAYTIWTISSSSIRAEIYVEFVFESPKESTQQCQKSFRERAS